MTFRDPIYLPQGTQVFFYTRNEEGSLILAEKSDDDSSVTSSRSNESHESHEELHTADQITQWQNSLCQRASKFAQQHTIISRLLLQPVAFIDIACESLYMAAQTAHYLWLSSLHLFKAYSDPSYTIKESLQNGQFALWTLCGVGVTLITALPKLVYQSTAILLNPANIRSMNGSDEEYRLWAPPPAPGELEE